MLFNFKNYYQSLIRKIATGLEASEEEVDFLFVSMHRVENSPGNNSKYVTVRQTGLMPHDFYDHILTSCDIIISDNIIQTSVSKAVVMETPHLIIEGNGCCESAPYPYNIFPVKQLFSRRNANISNSSRKRISATSRKYGKNLYPLSDTGIMIPAG